MIFVVLRVPADACLAERKIAMNDSPFSAVNEEAGQRMIKTNGVDLCTQAFGDPAAPALLLIMGATASMVRWPESLCRQLADSGLYVIRYDNRDTGISTSYPLTRRRTRRWTWPRAPLASWMPTASSMPTSGASRWAE
jgi:pimeloyl-ACP methyl ester carboxylesterase